MNLIRLTYTDFPVVVYWFCLRPCMWYSEVFGIKDGSPVCTVGAPFASNRTAANDGRAAVSDSELPQLSPGGVRTAI